MTDIVSRLRNSVSLTSRLDWQEHVALAREAAEELEKSTWRPIETAPRDMTEVLIAWADGITSYCVTNARWHERSGQWVNSWMAFSDDPNLQPTHWMPRPEAPAGEKETP